MIKVKHGAINKIANECGVSRQTVYNILKGVKVKFSEGTKEKVMEIAKQYERDVNTES